MKEILKIFVRPLKWLLSIVLLPIKLLISIVGKLIGLAISIILFIFLLVLIGWVLGIIPGPDIIGMFELVY